MTRKRSFLLVASAIILLVGIIGALQARKWRREPRRDIADARGKKNLVHVAIVGSGPAGSSAAVYCARFKRNVVVIKGPKPGGLLTETSDVENWPGIRTILGKELVDNIEHHAQSLGVTYIQDTVTSVDFNSWPFVLRTQGGDTIHALSVIIATGGTPLKLGVPGEQEYWGRGVSSCAKCDGFFYQGQEVVVVGGGDSAVEEAIQLAPYAKKITILVRKEAMKAARGMQDKLAAYPAISVHHNIEVTEIIGNDDDGVTGVMLFDKKTNESRLLPVDGVFLAIGHKPNTDLFAQSLSLDNHGYIRLDEGRSQKTSVSGIFAAGDAEDSHYRQAIVAAGSGVRAAIDADAYLTAIGLNAQMTEVLRSRQYQPEDHGSSVSMLESVDDFRQILASEGLVVAEFFQADCPACIELEPVFDAVAKERGAAAHFIKVDAQEFPELSQEFFVYRVPCVLLFKGGDLVARYGSQVTKEDLLAAIGKF